jgi:hypothetical protein
MERKNDYELMQSENNSVWILLVYIAWHFDNLHYGHTASNIHILSPHNEALFKTQMLDL